MGMMVVKLGSVLVMAGVVAAGTVTQARAGSEPDGGPYTVLALDGADVEKGSLVSGSVASIDGKLRLDRHVTVAGAVAAPHVVLRPDTLFEGLRCNIVTGGTASCEPMPVIDPAVFVRPDAQAGSENIRVPKKSRHSALAAGTYGKLTVGRDSQMLLVGGDYTFQSIRIDTRATFQCVEACTIAVRRGLKIGRDVVVLGAATDFRVSGRGGAGVKVGPKANVGATIYAPTASVKLGKKVNARGTLVGRRVTIGVRSFVGRVDPSTTAE
jgi:hypothetical protein